MTFRHKLARRLARLRGVGVALVVAGSQACGDRGGMGPSPVTTEPDGVADSARLEIERSLSLSSTSLWPNQPAGYSLITDRFFNAKVENGWQDRGDAAFSIVTDAAAPKSASKVGQALFRAGFPSGRGPINTWLTLRSRPTRLYGSFWLKLSSNWYGNDAGVNKVFFIWVHGNPSVFFNVGGAGMNPLQAQFRLQNVPVGPYNLMPNLGRSGAIVRGRWHRIEFVLLSNTGGLPNGEVHWWLDGVKIGAHKGLTFASSTQSNWWEIFSWNPTYGGMGSPVPHDQTMRMDHIYLSGS